MWVTCNENSSSSTMCAEKPSTTASARGIRGITCVERAKECGVRSEEKRTHTTEQPPCSRTDSSRSQASALPPGPASQRRVRGGTGDTRKGKCVLAVGQLSGMEVGSTERLF